jgi:hypothetical protein
MKSQSFCCLPHADRETLRTYKYLYEDVMDLGGREKGLGVKDYF